MCTGDSGGPLLRRAGGGWELAGATSRDGDFDVNPLCVGPTVFTGTEAHADWIDDTVKPGGC